MHLGRQLKLINECHRSYISATSFIDNKLAYIACSNTSSMEYLLPLAWFTRILFDTECSLNHEEFTYAWSDQNVILIFEFLFVSCFLNSLEFFHFPNGESSMVGMSIYRSQDFNGCRGSANFVVGWETFRITLGRIEKVA